MIGDNTATITIKGNTATYTGQTYGGCAYQPSELATAYNFNALYSQGLDGTGQTIVIVDAFGSPTLAADVALFNAQFTFPRPNYYLPCQCHGRADSAEWRLRHGNHSGR